MPNAPQAALDHLSENPDLAPQFREKYGYVPAPEKAVSYLQENPDLKDQFKQKYGYLPEDEGSFVGNALRGAGERGAELFGNLLQGGATLNRAAQENIGKVKDVLRAVPFPGAKALGSLPDDTLKKALSTAEQPVQDAADFYKNVDLGYVPESEWKDVKRAWKENDSPFSEIGKYALEQGIKSTPDMVGAVLALPSYITSRSVEIGEERARNEGREEPQLSDVLKASPFAVGSAILERVGAKGVTTDVIENVGKDALKAGVKKVAKEGGKGASKEAATEFIQEGIIEYVGEKYGTDAQMSFGEAMERGAAGAVAGGVYGGGISTGVGTGAAIAQARGPKVKPAEQAAQTKATENKTLSEEELDALMDEEADVPINDMTEEDLREAVQESRLRAERSEDIPLDEVIPQKRVDDMTPEEMRQALLTNDLTGLPNRRAFIEAEKKEGRASLDADSLKYFNDTFGHDAGNKLLQSIAQEMKDEGVEAYHISGDEFLIQADTQQGVEKAAKAVQERLKSTTLTVRSPDGRVFQYEPGISYGTGKTLSAAERELQEQKEARERSGERAARGDRPRGIRELRGASAQPGGGPQAVQGRVQSDEEVVGQALYDEGAAFEGRYTQVQDQTGGAPLLAPGQLNAGIPIEEVGVMAQEAGQKLQDALGIPGENVDVKRPERAKQPGFFASVFSPSAVARKYPQFAKYFQWANRAQETQERLRNVFQARLQAVEKILGRSYTGKLSKQYRENKKILREIRLTEDMNGVQYTAQEMRNIFGANDQVIKAHDMMRSAYDHALSLANKVRDERGKPLVSRREGYVPHFFHNFFVMVDGEIKASGRSVREAVSIGNKLSSQGDVTIVPKKFEFPGEKVQAAVVNDMAYYRVTNKLKKDFQLSLADAKEMASGLVRMKGRSRFVGNFYQRKGVEGFEDNLDWVDRHYFNMISRYAALDGFKQKSITAFESKDKFGDFNGEHQGLARYIKNYVNDINGVPTGIEDLINNTIEHVPVLRDLTGQYLGDRPALQLATATTNAVAIAKLGLYNVSAALVNGSQLVGSHTLLGPKYFAIGNARASALFSKKAMRFLSRDKLSQRASRDMGLLKQMGIDVQMGLESGAGYSKTAQMGKVFQASTAFFQGMEKYVRATTALGAYHKARSNGASHEMALQYGRGVNRRVNFDYSIVDAPNFIRRSGPAGQVLFQFKKFPVKMAEFMGSLKGMENVNFWTPWFLLAGYFAFPGVEALKEIIKGVTGKDVELELKSFLMDWAGDDEEKKKIANTIMYGIGSNAGVDVSHRIGGGDFIPSEPADLAGPAFSSVVRAAQMAAQENWAEALRAVSTAPGNIVAAMQQEDFSTSAYDRDRPVARTSPGDKALKSLGFRPTQEAVETDVKRIIQYETEQYREAQKQSIDQIIGAVTEYGSQLEAVKEFPKSEREEVLQAAEEKRQEEIDEAMERLADHGAAITPEQIENEVKAKNLTRSQRAYLNASKIIQAKTSRIYQFAN